MTCPTSDRDFMISITTFVAISVGLLAVLVITAVLVKRRMARRTIDLSRMHVSLTLTGDDLAAEEDDERSIGHQ